MNHPHALISELSLAALGHNILFGLVSQEHLSSPLDDNRIMAESEGGCNSGARIAHFISSPKRAEARPLTVSPLCYWDLIPRSDMITRRLYFSKRKIQAQSFKATISCNLLQGLKKVIRPSCSVCSCSCSQSSTDTHFHPIHSGFSSSLPNILSAFIVFLVG